MTETNAHLTPDLLRAFDEGRLSGADWSAVERHLPSCAGCAARLEGLPERDLAAVLSGDTAPSADAVPPALASHARYRALGVVGAGGMGTVYRAEHRLMGRVVALKVLHAQLTARPSAVERFRQEVRAAARLVHPNIVTAYDADEAGGAQFLVMEYVEGETLDKVLARRGPLPGAEACDWACQTAAGLQHAHECGMVHRDVKPANLILTPAGAVKILDFGLAQFASDCRTDPALTPEGEILGTPAYLAPEQARAPAEADIRADVYSLGCTLYHLLAGRPPFEGTTLQQLLAHQDREAPPLHELRPDVPRELSQVVARLLAKDPACRPATPAEAERELKPFALGATAADAAAGPTSRVRGRWVAAGILLAAAGVAAWYGFRGRGHVPPDDPPPGQAANPDPKKPPPDAGPERWDDGPTVEEQVLAWVRANNRFGPTSKIVDGTAAVMRRELEPGRAFVLRLCPTLTKANRHTLLAGRHRDLFAFEFTPVQAGDWTAERTTDFVASGKQSQEFHPRRLVRLSDPKIDNSDALEPGKEVTGSVAYVKLADPPGKVTLRVTCVVRGKTLTLGDIYGDAGLKRKGRLRFTVPAPVEKQEKNPGQPLVAFLELGAWDPRPGVIFEVMSNTVAVPLLVREN